VSYHAIDRDFCELLVASGMLASHSRTRARVNSRIGHVIICNRLEFLFSDVPIRNARVLDIGGGRGLTSFCAAHLGAREVVCLEPEASGSTAGAVSSFQETRSRLGLDDLVSLRTATLQDADFDSEQFDVVLLQSSVNHLDEEACRDLHVNPRSREIYKRLFEKIRAIVALDGFLIISDCSRYNFFATIGLRNPFAPTINWDIHQSPATWLSLLEPCGFDQAKITWWRPNKLSFVWPYNTVPSWTAYFINSHFRISLRRASS
jgi:SAM-dependent methyltransferase